MALKNYTIKVPFKRIVFAGSVITPANITDADVELLSEKGGCGHYFEKAAPPVKDDKTGKKENANE